jgi:hypothetical protein
VEEHAKTGQRYDYIVVAGMLHHVDDATAASILRSTRFLVDETGGGGGCFDLRSRYSHPFRPHACTLVLQTGTGNVSALTYRYRSLDTKRRITNPWQAVCLDKTRIAGHSAPCASCLF